MTPPSCATLKLKFGAWGRLAGNAATPIANGLPPMVRAVSISGSATSSAWLIARRCIRRLTNARF
eukprot:scaffold1727_cov119-Isochrysis_galbana.AAC.4